MAENSMKEREEQRNETKEKKERKTGEKKEITKTTNNQKPWCIFH